MAREFAHAAAVGEPPGLNDAVLAAADDPLAARERRDRAHRALMRVDALHRPSGRRVPDDDRAVVAPGDDVHAVGGEARDAHGAGVCRGGPQRGLVRVKIAERPAWIVLRRALEVLGPDERLRRGQISGGGEQPSALDAADAELVLQPRRHGVRAASLDERVPGQNGQRDGDGERRDHDAARSLELAPQRASWRVGAGQAEQRPPFDVGAQIRGERGGRGIASIAIARDGAADDLLQRSAQIGVGQAQRRRFGFEDPPHRLGERNIGEVEGQPARQHAEEQDAQRVDVAADVDVAGRAAQLLGLM